MTLCLQKARKIISIILYKVNTMKVIFKKFIIVIAMTSLIFVVTGCENEGSAEKAGKKIDQTFDSIKKKIDDAKE